MNKHRNTEYVKCLKGKGSSVGTGRQEREGAVVYRMVSEDFGRNHLNKN